MKILKLFVAISISILAIQCNKENDDINSDETSNVEVSELNSSIPKEVLTKLKGAGFDTNQEIIKSDDGYVVEGDMIITESYLDEIDSDSLALGDNNIAKQAYARGHLVRCSRVRDITVKNNLRDFDGPIRAALNDWNRVNGSFLRFRLVSRGRVDVNINRKRGQIGIAALPSGGKPGRFIDLDPALLRRSVNRNQLNATVRFIIRHELGHIIGFAHTNIDDSVPKVTVPGTPRADNKSIMNGAGSLANIVRVRNLSFSGNDKKALRKLYGGSARNNVCF